MNLVGWLAWKTMLLLAALGFALVTFTIVMLVWFMFEVGFAWVAWVVIVLASALVLFAAKNRGTGFDIRR